MSMYFMRASVLNLPPFSVGMFDTGFSLSTIFLILIFVFLGPAK